MHGNARQIASLPIINNSSARSASDRRLTFSDQAYVAIGRTTMLAEIFMLRLEDLLRTPIEPTSFTKSDTRFVPIKQPVPEKEGQPQIDK